MGNSTDEPIGGPRAPLTQGKMEKVVSHRLLGGKGVQPIMQNIVETILKKYGTL
jgi:hypothetical protein